MSHNHRSMIPPNGVGSRRPANRTVGGSRAPTRLDELLHIQRDDSTRWAAARRQGQVHTSLSSQLPRVRARHDAASGRNCRRRLCRSGRGGRSGQGGRSRRRGRLCRRRLLLRLSARVRGSERRKRRHRLLCAAPRVRCGASARAPDATTEKPPPAEAQSERRARAMQDEAAQRDAKGAVSQPAEFRSRAPFHSRQRASVTDRQTDSCCSLVAEFCFLPCRQTDRRTDKQLLLCGC
jgi:hypothetical protein